MGMITLGEIARQRSEKYAGDPKTALTVGLEHLTPDSLVLKSWSSSGDSTFTKAFRKGDILFGRRRAYQHKAALAPFDGVCSGDIIVITPKEGKVDKDLLPFLIQNPIFFDYAVGKSAGSLSPRVKWEHLKEFKFNLPSLPEQRKLADILVSIQETIDSYEILLTKIDAFIRAHFAEMFDAYGKVDLSTLADITMGQSPDSESYNDEGNGMPFFQGKADYGEKIATVAHWTTEPTKIVGANVVLMSVRAPVGPVNFSPVQCCLGRGLCGINAKEGKTNNEFLYNALNTMQEEIAAKGVGSTFAAITKKDIYKIKIPSAPVNLMDDFSTFAGQMDKTKSVLRESLAYVIKIYRGILASKLVGKKD